ncbi:permease [Streptomyces sp. NPDC005195]|uniref:permease n=1 Tax=Streptomyces sp. NPDC005195 TaxID=3154561 RepID=UPI0033BE1D4E
MTWEITWALILGFALSAVVQAVVRKSTVVSLLGDDRPRTLAIAAGLGAASSSCSYAAVALARSLFRKGANFTAAMGFEIASTNLVVELGVILALLMGWQFTAAEFFGGPIMIVVLAVLFRLFLRDKLLREAREQAERGLAGSMEGHAAMDMSVQREGSFAGRLLSREGFTSTSHVFVMEWAAILRDLVIGLLIAGAIAAWVPDSFWRTFFFDGHPLAAKLWGPIIGPLVAIASFVCSIGNVPLAVVLWKGGISFGGVVAFVEAGPTHDILANPQDEYTRHLLASAPSQTTARPRIPATTVPKPDTAPLVEVRNLVKEFRLPRAGDGPRTLRAVDDVSFTLHRGQTLALAGESGSGKSTTARLVLRLADATAGQILFDGTDATTAKGARARHLRRHAQLVYQNPYASLDPRFSIDEVITEPLRAFKVGDRASRLARTRDLLDRVALPAATLERRPAEMSGGQRQRVALARALSPDLVVCDEPVSALDVSVQAQVLSLLVELQADTGVAYLLISHDLAVVRQIAHQVAVMQAGRIVETGPPDELFTLPRHEYTRELLAAIPGGRVPTPTAETTTS